MLSLLSNLPSNRLLKKRISKKLHRTVFFTIILKIRKKKVKQKLSWRLTRTSLVWVHSATLRPAEELQLLSLPSIPLYSQSHLQAQTSVCHFPAKILLSNGFYSHSDNRATWAFNLGLQSLTEPPPPPAPPGFALSCSPWLSPCVSVTPSPTLISPSRPLPLLFSLLGPLGDFYLIRTFSYSLTTLFHPRYFLIDSNTENAILIYLCI